MVNKIWFLPSGGFQQRTIHCDECGEKSATYVYGGTQEGFLTQGGQCLLYRWHLCLDLKLEQFSEVGVAGGMWTRRVLDSSTSDYRNSTCKSGKQEEILQVSGKQFIVFGTQTRDGRWSEMRLGSWSQKQGPTLCKSWVFILHFFAIFIHLQI